MPDQEKYPQYKQFRGTSIGVTLRSSSDGVIYMSELPPLLTRVEMAASAIIVYAAEAAILNPRWRTLPDERVGVPWLTPAQEAAYKRAEQAALTGAWTDALTWLGARGLTVDDRRPHSDGTWEVTKLKG